MYLWAQVHEYCHTFDILEVRPYMSRFAFESIKSRWQQIHNFNFSVIDATRVRALSENLTYENKISLQS